MPFNTIFRAYHSPSAYDRQTQDAGRFVNVLTVRLVGYAALREGKCTIKANKCTIMKIIGQLVYGTFV